MEVAGEIRTAVPINEFAKHVSELHADGDIGFSKEYEAIQNESISEEYPSEHSQHPDNKQKNRYLNIIACMYLHNAHVQFHIHHINTCIFNHFISVSDDHSRVHLRPLGRQKKSVDYINANFIDGYTILTMFSLFLIECRIQSNTYR